LGFVFILNGGENVDLTGREDLIDFNKIVSLMSIFQSNIEKLSFCIIIKI
jgi:hypothetical protein